MTTLGTSSWGVILSSGCAGGVPSGDIIYWLCDDVDRELTTKDKTDHYASQTASTIPMGQAYYRVNANSCLYQAKTIASLNSHHAFLQAWLFAQTKIYLWVKDSASTYLDFIIASTTTDYLPCVVKNAKDKLKHNKLMVDLRLEETA